MRSIRIGRNEDGQRLDRVLARLFPNAGKGFLFKMLRKKNITLNGKKAEGSERLSDGDEIKVFFSEETFLKLSEGEGAINEGKESMESTESVKSGNSVKSGKSGKSMESLESVEAFKNMIVYEDEDVIILNKPKGVLSQKAEANDYSLNEMLIDYMLSKNMISQEGLKTFRPSMCNRLDRNTEGLICGGKTLRGLRGLSEMFRERKLSKYYLCIVKGILDRERLIQGYLVKDEETNRVSVVNDPYMRNDGDLAKIATKYKPLKTADDCTLLEVELITGKSHQIRAHLASIGHPIAGDMKYGDTMFNRHVRDRYKVKSQLLIAYRLVFPKDCGELKALSGREFALRKPVGFFI